MKRIVFICAVAALAFSCSKGQLNTPRMVEWAFETDYTKASIDDSGAFQWLDPSALPQDDVPKT